MKYKIFTLSFSLFLFVLSFAQSPEHGIYLPKKTTTYGDRLFAHSPKKPFSLPDSYPVESETTIELRGYHPQQSVKNHPAMAFENNLNEPTTSLFSPTINRRQSLQFRGEESRLDSTYVFAVWLGTEQPFEKIYYAYDDEDNLAIALHQQTNSVSRILYTYDESNTLVSSEHQFLDWQGAWSHWKLFEYRYVDPATHPDTIKTYYWNYVADDWSEWKREVYTLNSNGQPSGMNHFYFDDEAGFVKNERTFYEYGHHDQLLAETRQRYCVHGDTMAWRNFGQILYSYKPTGELEYKVTARWDTDDWRETERSITHYDDLANPEQEDLYYSRAVGEPSWVPTQREAISYQDGGKYISVDYDQFGSQQWAPQWTTDSVFNDNGWLTEVTTYATLCDPHVIPVLKKSFVYDLDETLKTINIQQWDASAQDWKSSQRELFGYDADKKIQLWTLQKYEADLPENWTNIYQRNYAYDSLSYVTTIAGKMWIGSGWINDGLSTFHYDSLFQLSEEVFSYWNGEIWKTYSKETHTYNEEGRLAETMDWTWSFNGSWYWKPGSIRTSFAYDDFGRQILQEIALQNYKLGNWETRYRIHTAYDDMTGRLKERKTEQFKLTNHEWQWEQSNQHFWREEITGDWEALNGGLQCRFANPTQPGGTIYCEGTDLSNATTLCLYDLMGRLRYQTRFGGQGQLDFQLAAGCYILVIRSEDRVLFREALIVQ